MKRMTQQIEEIRYKELHLVAKGIKRSDKEQPRSTTKILALPWISCVIFVNSYTSLSLFPFLSNTDISRGSMIRTLAVRVMDKQVGNRKAESGGGYKLFQNWMYYDH